MNKPSGRKSITFASIALATLTAPLTAVQADQNPFAFSEFGSAFQVADSGAEAKCGEAKCGDAPKPKKTTEAKCGADKKATAEAKCGSNPAMPMDESH